MRTTTICIVILIVGSMIGLLWLRRKQISQPLDPESKYIVTITETEVVCQRPDGKTESVIRAELQSLEVMTTSDGPYLPDVFWILRDKRGGCVIPMGATGEQELLNLLQSLPGFNNSKFIEAMSSTDDRTFTCWRMSS